MEIFKRRRQSISEPRAADHIGAKRSRPYRRSHIYQSKRSHIEGVSEQEEPSEELQEQEEPSEEQVKQTEPYMPQTTLSGAVEPYMLSLILLGDCSGNENPNMHVLTIIGSGGK